MNEKLLEFIDALKDDLKKEQANLIELIAFGEIPLHERPYEYFVGQVKAYQTALNMVQSHVRRMNRPAFTGEGDDGYSTVN